VQLLAVAATLLFVVGVRSSELIESILWAFLTLAVCTFPASTGVALLRYRLWDIDLVINRALVYGTLTACVFAVPGVRGPAFVPITPPTQSTALSSSDSKYSSRTSVTLFFVSVC
jgi:hypothetical protein